MVLVSSADHTSELWRQRPLHAQRAGGRGASGVGYNQTTRSHAQHVKKRAGREHVGSARGRSSESDAGEPWSAMASGLTHSQTATPGSEYSSTAQVSRLGEHEQMDDPDEKKSKRADPQRVDKSGPTAVEKSGPTAGEKSIANSRQDKSNGGWKKPKTVDDMSMSMKVMKVDGSVDENNGLKYTVGDKSLGLLSTTIDKALGGMLKGEEAHLKCSPEYAEGATIDLTLLQKAEKAISDKTATEKAESENVAAKTNYAYEHDDGAAGCTKEGGDRHGTSQTKLMSCFIQQPEASNAAHTRQSGQIVGMLEQMLSHIQSDT